MSASFSKHTFSRSIFRTVTCNKVRKEQRCSCLCVSHLDLVVVSLSAPEKGEHFFFQGKIISVAFFSFFYTTLFLLSKPASALPVPTLQLVAFAGQEERDVFSLFQ